MTILECDVCVVGGGSGGFGAALSAARQGAHTILIEKNSILGGTSTCAWVHTWEPSYGVGGICRELWTRMQHDPLGATRTPYEQSSPRIGGKHLVFEPHAFHINALEMLKGTGFCGVLLGTAYCGADLGQRHVRSIRAYYRGTGLRIRAELFIDATADGNLCVDAGCEYYVGTDPRGLHDEPSAPVSPSPRLNGMTLMYRIRDMGTPQPRFLPDNVNPADCPLPHADRVCPNNDVLVNAVDMIDGNMTKVDDAEFIRREAYRRVYAHVYALQEDERFRNYALVGIAPEIGVRESRRIIGDYVLTEHDILAGLKGQEHSDIIAVTDHAVDIHGADSRMYEVPNGPYGIPFRCLIPKDAENVLVACRGASFSHIAASSCRLSRAMMTLGQAAGTAAAIALQSQRSVRDIDVGRLRETLAGQGVELA